MPKSLPAQFITEKNKTAAAAFNALLIQFPGGAVTLTDQAQAGATLLGAPTLPIVKDWGRLDGVLNLREGVGALSALRIRGLNHPGTGGSSAARFSDLFPASTLEATVVSLAQCFWSGGAPGGSITSTTFFSGVIRDPVEYSETEWSFEITSLAAHYLGRDYGVSLNQVDFPYMDKRERGAVIPTVYGSVRSLPLVGLKSRSATQPSSATSNQSLIALSDAIVNSSLAVQETWTFTMSNADAFIPSGLTTPAGTFLADIAWNNSAGADGLLYATDGTTLYKYSGGWVDAGRNVPAGGRFSSLGSFGGKLFAGGLGATGKNTLWRLDPSGWTQVFAETGAFAQGGIDRLGTSSVRIGVLLAGAQSTTGGSSALYSYDGASVTNERTQSNNGSGNFYSNFIDFQSSAYVAEREAGTSTVNLLKWNGSTWTTAHTGAADELSSTSTLFVFGSTPKLYAFGPSGGPNHPKTFTWDGASWALDNDFGSHAGTGSAIVYNAAAYVFFNDGTAAPLFSKLTTSTWSAPVAMALTGDRAVLYTNTAPAESQMWVIGETAGGTTSTIYFDDTIGAYAFSLTGSVTGADGSGNVGGNFVSNSQKIGIDRSFWSGVPGIPGDTISFVADNSYFEYAVSLTSPSTQLKGVLTVYVDRKPDSSWQLLQNQTRAGQNCAVIRFINQKSPQLVNTLSGSGTFNGATGVDLGVIPGLTNVRLAITPQGSATSVTPYVKSKTATRIQVAAGAGDSQAFDFSVKQDFEGAVTADIAGIQDDATGTYTAAANALITRPAHVIHHFLRVGCDVPEASIDSAGTFAASNAAMPSNYAFNGAIASAQPLREVVSAMVRQGRCLFDWSVAARLFFRPTSYATQAVSKALTQSVIRKDSITVRRTPVSEVINDVNVRYLRDFSKSRGANAYAKLQRVTDAASIASFGSRTSTGLGGREADDLFMFDFVTDDGHALDLANFYLARFRNPTRRITVDVFLDQFEIDRGDVITIDYAVGGIRFDALDGSARLLVERVVNLPGNATKADAVRLTCLAI
jgi:hypothetical protein